LHVGQDALAHFGVEADELATTEGVAQAGRFAHPKGDAARGFDLGQGVIGLGDGRGGGQAEDSASKQGFLHACILWSTQG